MIKGVVIKNYLDEKMTIEMGNPQKTGIYIKNIDGLGLPSMSVQTDEAVNYNISNYLSSSISPRNLVLTFGITDDEYVETTRRKLYKYFIPQFPTQLEIVTDVIGSVSIVGYVESFDPDIFSNAETVQISLICPDPYFYTGGKITESSDNKTGLFNFTSWYEENTKKYVNTPSVSKPVSILEEKNGDGGQPIDISYMSRVFNPKGFELEIYQDENAFQKIVLDYLNGSITVNPGEIDPRIEKNQFNNCSLLIKNSPEDQNVYKKDKTTGNLMSLLDLCLIEGDFPNLVPGKNYFRAKIYGLYTNEKDYYDYLIPDLYTGEPYSIGMNYPLNNNAFDVTIIDVHYINNPNRMRWGEEIGIGLGYYKKNTFHHLKVRIYRGYSGAPTKYMGTIGIYGYGSEIEHYVWDDDGDTLIWVSKKTYVEKSDKVTIEINGKNQNAIFTMPSQYDVPDSYYEWVKDVPIGIGLFIYILNESYASVGIKPPSNHGIDSIDISENNIFQVNNHFYGIYAVPVVNRYYKEHNSSTTKVYNNILGEIPLVVKIEDLNVSKEEFFDYLFSKWGNIYTNTIGHSVGDIYGYREYYARIYKNQNEGNYDETVKVLRESYDGNINISYDERYDAI